ncbi:hypothetical protein TNIN_107231 [Trichonephila inaurata madagascariensis]|uniref:Uncharacterized protein n=1 Tax=Trichonephila inaurata madagascariensis TaxID=2747483 RepID=A0A8X7C5L2_9ARAC|nr:hypothetical protein TNIN_460701 [Trichonephila inaurata madagascariensis]GFY66331.1 hypothetical protein TNIN_107231 [Trichonephila inaurata madagascariensis]
MDTLVTSLVKNRIFGFKDVTYLRYLDTEQWTDLRSSSRPSSPFPLVKMPDRSLNQCRLFDLRKHGRKNKTEREKRMCLSWMQD